MFNERFDNWQHVPPPDDHIGCSPNLLLVLEELQRRWSSLTNLGCFGVRPVRGGTAASSHSFGAAIDVAYPASMDPTIESEVCGFLVGRSDELHVQAVHDYRRSRIWRAGRTSSLDEACSKWWRAQRPSSLSGMGQPWANHLHLEVTAAGWTDTTAMADRWTD